MSDRLFIVSLACMALFACFLELRRMDIVYDHEGQRATPPAEMLRSGDFVIPTINGKPYLAKPPLLYWATAAVYALTGMVSPLTARVPSALCFCATVVGVYLVMRRWGAEGAGRWAALALCASPYGLARGRLTMLDVPLMFAMFVVVCAFRAAVCAPTRSRSAGLSMLGGVAMGAAILLKGPAPFVFLWAAWVACCVAGGDAPAAILRKGIWWSAGAFGLEVLLRGVEWCLPTTVFGMTPWLAPGVPRLPFPLALAVVVAAWTFLAWKSGGARRGRLVGAALAVVGIGVAVAVPWMIAVLYRMGWASVRAIVSGEVLERTYTATEINSGSPFYYILALPVLTAPWGLLLPLQFSASGWRRSNDVYRFSVLAGWLSVLSFSLIAGKEHEYILPAFPLLLMAAGFHLAGDEAEVMQRWESVWLQVWRRFVPPALVVAALGMAAFFSAKRLQYGLLVGEVWCLAGIVVVAWGWARKRSDRRRAHVAVMALCVALMPLLERSFVLTGQRSYREVAEAAGALKGAGYEVEAAKMTAAFDVFPGFAFHARTAIPVVTDAGRLREKLEGNAPYYCAIRQEVLGALSPPLGEELSRPLLGPYTRKRVVLLGNRPLPASLTPEGERPVW